MPGWKRFKSFARRRQQQMFHMAYQAKLRSFRLAPKYKYQFEILQDYKHVVELNKRHGTTKWFDATKLKIVQLDD